MDSNVEYAFGGQMTFTLAISDPPPVAEAVLLVRAGPTAPTEVIPADLPPLSDSPGADSALTLKVVRNLTQRPYAPFATVEYWWQLTTHSGEQIESEHHTFVYEDNRFDWQTTTRGGISLSWYEGDLTFGQAAADAAASALQEIAADLDVPPPDDLAIYIYASGADLRAGLRLGGRDWVGGHANPELGVVLAAVSPGAEQLLTLRRVIPHELTHVMIYQLLGADYDNVPGWLNEGLAVMHEGDRNPVYQQALLAAAETEELISFNTLCGSFPLESDQAVLAYAQSGSLVSHLYEQRGAHAVNTLLLTYQDGASCESGVQRALGTDLAGLQAEWQRNALNASPVAAALRTAAPAFLCLLLPALSLAALALPSRRK